MATRKDLIGNGQQGQQQQDDKKKNWKDLVKKEDNNTNQKKNWKDLISGDYTAADTIQPAKSLQESLEGVEHNTAFSFGHIKDLAESAGDWFSNVWHTITDEDEDKGILDYSEYKRYKDILDSAPKNDIDLSAVYQQMANEGVIDYDKFTKWYNEEGAKENNKYYKYDKAVDAIKVNFDNKLGAALQPFMNGDDKSYEINALTKAREAMNSQFSMFLDGFATTYKSTRDNDLLKDFDKILNEYETDIINFTRQWASNLTSKDEGGMKAYYDTLNDEGMRDYAKSIRKIQFDMENKLTEAAMLSNFGDSWTALKNGNGISAFAELLGAGMNGVNWLLDKFIGNPVEAVKNTSIGWYDVVEELANLNVYSNDAGAMTKVFGTMASWVGDILDAAPTLVPMVADIVIGSKVGVVSKTRGASKLATKIDDAIGVVYKNQKAVKNLAKEGDLVINAMESGNLGTFPLQMLSRYLENVFVFDIACQQFEGNPISDDMLVYNFLFNLPVDTIASLLPEGSKLIAKGLTKSQLVTDVIDQDVFNMLSKHYNSFKQVLENGDKASKELEGITNVTDKLTFDRSAIMAANQAKKQGQEKYYMAQSLIERRGTPSKKTVNLSDEGLDQGLVSFIRETQEASQDVYDRLATFGGSLDDYIQEMETRLTGAKRRGMSLEKIANDYVKSVEQKSKVLNARRGHAVTYGNINYLYKKLNSINNGEQILNNALDKVFEDGDLLKDLLRELIFKTDQGTYVEILKKANELENNLTFDEISKKVSQVMSTIMSDNKDIIEEGDMVLGWVKQSDGTFTNMMTGETLSQEQLVEQYGKGLTSTSALADSYVHQFNGILDNISLKGKEAFNINGNNITKASTDIKGGEVFYDISEELEGLGIPLIKAKWQGKKWDELLTKDASAVVYDDAYSNMGLRILTKEDGTIGVFGTEESVQNIRDNISKIKKLSDNSDIDSSLLDTYKFLFTKDLDNEVNKNILSINNLRKEKGLEPLTNEELVGYAKEHKSFLDSAYTIIEKEEHKEIKKATKSWNTKKGRPAQTKKTKANISKKNDIKLKKGIKDAAEGKTTYQDVELDAAKALVEDTTNGLLGSLLGELSFVDRLSKKFQTLFEGHWTTKSAKGDAETIKKISNRFANIISNLAGEAGNLTENAEVLEKMVNTLSGVLGTVMLSPLTISTMKDGGDELIYGLLGSAILFGEKEGKQSAGVLFRQINNSLDSMLKGKLNEQMLGKQVGYQLYQFKESLTSIYKAIREGDKQLSQEFKDALITKLKPYIEALSMEDFNKGKEIWMHTKSKIDTTYIGVDKLNKILYNKVEGDIKWRDLLGGRLINLEQLSDEDIDLIAQAIATSQMGKSYLFSEKLYNNLYLSAKKGITDLRKSMTEGNSIPISFNIKESGSRYVLGTKGEVPHIEYGLLSDAQLLGNLDDKVIYENTIAHEYGHAKIHTEAEFGSDYAISTDMNVLLGEGNNGLFSDYIEQLISRYRKALIDAKGNKNTKLTLTAYYSKYDYNTFINTIIDRYQKDKLVEKLVEDFKSGKVDRYTDVRKLGNIMGENEVLMGTLTEKDAIGNRFIIEEYINELATLAELGNITEGGLLDLGVKKQIDEALDVLSKASEVVDRFRYLLATKADINEEGLRKELSYVFDAYSQQSARNSADSVAETLLKGVQRVSDNPREAVKSLSDLINKIKLQLKSTDVNTLKKEIIAKLSMIENSTKLQREYKVSENLAREFRGVITSLNKEKDLKILLNDLNVENFVPKTNKATTNSTDKGLAHSREVYFLDVGETNVDIQYDDMFRISAGDNGLGYITPVLRKKHSSKYEKKIGAKAESEALEQTPGGVSSQHYLRKTAANQVDIMLQQEMEQAVPLIKSLATMGEDLGSYGTDAIAVLNKLIGDLNKSIDKNKLLVGDETIKAFKKYIKKGGKNSFGNFIVNRLFANVLGEMGIYDEATVASINNLLKNAQYDAVKASISGQYNRGKNKFFVQIFNNLKENYYIERGIGKPIKDTSEEALRKIEPKLSKEEWEAARKEYNETGIETIGKYYNFDRGIVSYEVDGIKKKANLNTYEGYSQYYDDWEIPMTYTKWQRVDIDANEVLRGATEGEMYRFNEAICRYIDALKAGEGIDEALEGVTDAFLKIIDDAGTASHQNFRFMSLNGIDTSTFAKEQSAVKGIKLIDKLPSKKSKNIAKKFMQGYNEKPLGIKKPNNVEELILSLAKGFMDSEGIKVGSDEDTLATIVEQLISKNGDFKDYKEEVKYLISQINDVYRGLMGEEEDIVGGLNITAGEADDMIEGIWLDFVNTWNKRLAKKLGVEKNIRFDKAEEKSLDTLEFLKTMSNDNIMSNSEFSLDSMSNLGEIVSKETSELKEEGLDISDITEGEIDLFGGAIEGNVGYGDARQSIRNSIESFVDGGMIDRDMENYKIFRDSNTYQIDEKGISDSSKEMTVNLGVFYNSLKNTDEIDAHSANALEIWKAKDEATLDAADKQRRKDAFNIFGKLTSYSNGSFINGNLVKNMNMYGVNSIFGKTIGGEKVGFVQVVLDDGSNILLSPAGNIKVRHLLGDNVRDNGKTLVRFSTLNDDLSFTQSVYNSLLKNNGGVEVRFLNDKGEQLSFQSVNSNDVWKSFIGEEISNYIGLGGNYKLNLSTLDSSVLYKQLGLKGGSNNTVNYNDIVKVTESLGGDTVGLNNQAMMQFIYQKICDRLDNVYVSSWLASRGIGEVPESYKAKENLLRKIKDDLKFKMTEAGYKVDTNSENFIKKLTSLEIDASPRFYNLDGTPFKKGTWVKDEHGMRQSGTPCIKVIKEYPDGHRTTEYVPGIEDIYNNIGEKTGTIKHKSYYVKVNDAGKEISDREFLDNKYRVIGVKPKVNVFNTTDTVTNNLSKEEIRGNVKQIIGENVPEGTLIKSYFYNGNKKGGYIPLDDTTNIDSELFWEQVDNRILESEMGQTLGLSTKVDKDSGEMIIVLANDNGWETEAMLKQVPVYDSRTGETYLAYKLYFNNDSELGLGLADTGKAYDFYKKYSEFKNDLDNIDFNKTNKIRKEISNKVKNFLSKKNKELKDTFWQSDNNGDSIYGRTRLYNDKGDLKLEGYRGQLPFSFTIDKSNDNIIIKANNKVAKNIFKNAKKVKKESTIVKTWNKENNSITIPKDNLGDALGLLQIGEDGFLKEGQLKGTTLGNNINNIELLEDSSFINGDDILTYTYEMPLLYSRGAKLAEDRGLIKGSEEANKVKDQWTAGWKDQREITMMTYENGREKRVRGKLMEYDDYQNYLKEKAEADKLVNKTIADKAKKVNPNFRETKLEAPEEPMSLSDIIEGGELSESQLKILGMAADDETFDTTSRQIIKDNYDIKTVSKQVKQISDMNVSREVYSSSEGMQDVFNFSNFDILGGNNTLSQLRGENANFKRVYGEQLTREGSKWNTAFGKLTDNEKKTLVDGINKKVNSVTSKGIYRIDKVFAEPQNEAQEIINNIAGIFNNAGWNNAYILNKIHDENSLDNLIYKTFNTYQNVSMGMFSNLKNTDDVRQFVFNAARSMGAKDKRAFNLSKDWVGDPLGTGPFMRFLANVRSAYRFAKYSLLSPVSGTLMYLNSVVMSEPLLWAKRSGLGLYYGDSNFKALVKEEGVTNWLERDSDIILQGANGMQMNGLAVDKAINKVAGVVGAPFGSKTKKKIQAAALGGVHSVYDMQRSGSVREYAFAQALKQNGVETKEAIADLLQKVRSGEINDAKYANRWRNIMADTEENYARFFSNANTTALSRHRWSRAFGFNFLQGYVINRADEMNQGIKKLYNFLKERGVKNLTWDDVTYHLAHDNIELKSFLNNIILTTKLGYYLDRIDDDDGSPSKNMAGYFIDANDYLSSLDTIWFMRLFKTIPNGISDYMEYSDYAKKDATVSGAAGNVAYQLTSEICSQFFREGKFLNAMMQTIVAGMKTGDLDFAATVAGVEWEKMSNGLGRFGLVDGLEKYGLEDFTEPSDIIGSVLFSTNKTSTSGKIQDKMWALSNTDKVINDPGYAAVTAIGYLPLVGELIKSATDNGGFGFSEAKYREMMNMVENDKGLQELYKGKLNTDIYSDDAIGRIWSDFTSFNYPAKYEKEPGIHAVGSYIEGKDTTLNSMKEDVFVQNICEKMGITVEELHNMISSDSAKTTGKLKVMAAAEAAEPGSGKIVLSYMLASRLYELEKQYTGKQYPTNADVGDEAMAALKRIALEEMGEGMFTADKVSWYKAIREYISEVNPEVFKTLYKNETLNSYVGSIGFLDSLMYDAAQKGDVDAKYIKNARSVLSKYMKDTDARTSAVEYLFSQAENLNIPASGRHMVMEGILAGNIDFYNTLKNSPVLSTIYADTLNDFEHRLWGVLDEVDIVDDEYKKQNKKKGYTPYTSNYGDNNKKVEDDLKDKANQYFPKSSGKGNRPGLSYPKNYTEGSIKPKDALDWYRKYYEGLIKTYSDRLVKSTGKKYPAQGTESITFKTGSNNRGGIRGQKLEFPKHQSKEYRTKVFSNLPGSHG